MSKSLKGLTAAALAAITIAGIGNFMEVTCSTWWGKKWVDWGYSRYAPNAAGITCGFGNRVLAGRLARNDWVTLARY